MDYDQLAALAEQYKAAVEAGNTYEALTHLDAMLVQLAAQLGDGHAISQRDLQGIVTVLVGATLLLVRSQRRMGVFGAF